MRNQNTNKPPRPPPLSVSLPSPPRPDPKPDPKPKPIPKPDPKPISTPPPDPDESPHSPLRSESPHQSTDPDPTSKYDTALVPVVEKYYSPLTSPLPLTPPKDHIVHFTNRQDVGPTHTAVSYGGDRKRGGGGGPGVRFGGVDSIGGGGSGGERGLTTATSNSTSVLKKVGLGVRVVEIVFCLISFSVMASDKTQGWSGDSFDRYKEYRFCLSVTILGFMYSAFQAYDLAYYLGTGKHVIRHHLRYQFEFIMDQILAYLLISASSAAASRVDDWQANWGKDQFTEKASASVSMAFIAFLGFAMSSLISGYNFCNRDIL